MFTSSSSSTSNNQFRIIDPVDSPSVFQPSSTSTPHPQIPGSTSRYGGYHASFAVRGPILMTNGTGTNVSNLPSVPTLRGYQFGEPSTGPTSTSTNVSSLPSVPSFRGYRYGESSVGPTITSTNVSNLPSVLSFRGYRFGEPSARPISTNVFETPLPPPNKPKLSTTTPGRLSSILHPTPSTTSATPRSVRTLVESVDAHTVVALVEGRGQARGEVGMACINLQTSHLILCQFSDTQTYHRVIAKLNIFRPHEILMSSTCCSETGIASQLYTQLQSEVANVKIIPLQRKVFSEGQGLQRIKQLVVDNFAAVIQLITQKYYCLAATSALLRYVELLESIVFSPKSMRVEFQGCDKTCMIDSKTAQHLELLQNNHQLVSVHSVLGMLSNCKTPGGSRLLRMNILQPPCDLKLIQQRLDCVDELIENREALFGLQDILARLPVDIELVISTLIQIPKMDNSRTTEQRINYVIALKHTLELLPTFTNILENTQNDFFQSIREDFRSPIFQEILEKIQRVINEEAQVQKGSINMQRQRCFAVKGEVNAILDIARKAYCELVENINDYIANISAKMKMSFRLGQNAKRGFYIQLILPGRGDQIPELPNTFLHVKKCRNVISFTTDYVLNCDHRTREILKEVENVSAIVVADLVGQIREDISSLYKISEAVASLDVLYTLANYSVTTLRCVRPRFSESATAITMGRHPVLEMVKTCPSVPNNTFLSEDTNFLLITGPNMSGKTTYLKQVATLQILAQLGSFVPAEAATFRIASNIFSRIGTGDNIEDSASSFAVEMAEMNYILSNINDNSLIIIDELGRGTSCEEGTGISWAIAEALLVSKSFTLFATHYLFLTKLENFYSNVFNYTMETQEWQKTHGDAASSVSRDDEEMENPLETCKLKYTHVLKRGVTDVAFYGLKLASNSSYPQHIVNNALSIADGIIENRKKSNRDDDSQSYSSKRRQALYLLGSQLVLAAAEASNGTDPTEFREYLKSLRRDFKTMVGDDPDEEDMSESEASGIAETGSPVSQSSSHSDIAATGTPLSQNFDNSVTASSSTLEFSTQLSSPSTPME